MRAAGSRVASRAPAGCFVHEICRIGKLNLWDLQHLEGWLLIKEPNSMTTGRLLQCGLVQQSPHCQAHNLQSPTLLLLLDSLNPHHSP